MKWLIPLFLSVCAFAQLGPELPDGIPFAGAASGSFGTLVVSSNGSCASGTTCVVSLTSSIGAGDWVEVCGNVNNGAVFISGTNNGGTFVQDVGATTLDYTGGYGQSSCGHIVSANSQATNITIDYSATNGAGIVMVWDQPYSGATPAVDGANGLQLLTQTSFQMPLFTTSGSGSGDISFQYGRDSTINSISSPFHTKSCPQAYACGSYLASAVSGSIQPTWTLNASSTVSGSEVNIGFSPTSFLNQLLVETSGTATNAVTAASLIADVKGQTFGYPELNGTGCTGVICITYQTATGICGSTAPPAPGATGRLGDGGNYTDASAQVIQYLSTANQQYIRFGGTGGAFPTATASLGFWYCSDLSISDGSTVDVTAIAGTGNADFNNAHEFSDGSTKRAMEIECNGNTSSSSIELARNTWYWIDLFYCGTGTCGTSSNHTMKIYNSSLVQQGSTLTCASKGTTQVGTFATFGDHASNAITGAAHWWYYHVKVSLDGTDPLMP